MAYSARERYRKKNDIRGQEPILSDMGLSLERDKERDARIKAIELARQNSLNRQQAESTSSANAGDNRTTAYNRPQTMSVYGGLGTMPNPQTQGMNTAANGADIDYTTVNQTANKGWKGLSALNGSRASKKTVSQKESLAHANDVMKPYENNTKAMDILRRYSDLEDTQDRSGMLNFQSIGAYSGQFDKLANDFINETGVSMDEFRQIAENYSYIKHSDERNEAKAKKKEQNAAVNIAQGIGEAALSPLTNYQAMIGAMQNPNDPELGRDYNSPFMRHLNAQEDTKEAYQAKTESLSPVAKTLANLGYDLAVTGTQSTAAALTGEVGLGSFAAGGYATNLEESDERGLTEGQAQVYSAVSGGLEYITERLPIEHLKKIYNGSAIGKSAAGSLKPYIKAALEQMGEEASEELVNGIADTVADGLINGDKSKVNATIQSNINNGMSEDEATKSAYIGLIKDTGYSMLVAALSTGVSAGPSLATQAIETTRAGRNIADYENKTGNLTRNVENEVYIPTEREYYTADEDYNQAQSTREAILAAAEKVANNQRISGKEARAIAEQYDTTRRNISQAEAVRAQQIFEGAKAKSEEKVVEQINKASTPAELETIIEEHIESEAIKEAAEAKKTEMIEAGKATEQDFAEAITPTKAQAMAEKGEVIEQETLEQLPKKVQQAYELGNVEQANKLTSDVTKTDISTISYTDKEGKSAYSDIKNISQNKSGEIVFELESGETVKAAEAKYTTKGDKLYNSPNGINSLDNATLVQLAIDIEKNSKHGVAVGTVTNALKDMYTLGAAGLSFEQGIKSRKYDLKVLGEDKLRAAFEEGKKNFNVRSRSAYAAKGQGLIKESTEENREAYENQFVKAVKESNNRTIYVHDEQAMKEYEDNLSQNNKSFLEAFSKKIGVDIAFIYDTNTANRGQYIPEQGRIYLNLAYSHNMFNVALHEGIGEFLAASNEKAYNQIVDSVLNAYAATNSSKLASDIRAYQKAYAGDKYGDSARGASYELFNDALSDIFGTEENMKKLFDWMVTNEGEKQTTKVKKTLIDYFKNVVDSIKDIRRNGLFSKRVDKQMEIAENEASKYVDQILKAMDEAIATANLTDVVEKKKTKKKSSKNKEEIVNNADERNSIKVDSDGNSLSEGQQEYFADSKIRDDQGRLKVMYHGTQQYGFTVFDKRKAKGSGYYGRGFYFSSEPSHAGQYGEQYKVYLNITNPMQSGDHNITKDQLRAFVEAVAEDEDYGIENYGYDATVDSVTDDIWSKKDDFAMLQDINAACVGDFVAAVKLFNEINGTDYDGIVVPTETVAFEPNQIKNVDNLNPTNNEDIRFSLKAPVEETKSLIAVHNLHVDDMLRTLDLGGFPMPSIAITKPEMGHDMYGNVSVIFNKDTIDPKFMRANKVYSGDAYTPTFPSIGYKIDSDKIYDIREKIDKLLGDDRDSFGYMGLDTDNVTDYLERNKGNVVDAFANKDGYKYAFIKDKGFKVDIPMKESRLSVDYDNDVIKYIALMFTPEQALRSFQNSKETYDEFNKDGRMEKVIEKINAFEKKSLGPLYKKYHTTEVSFREFDQLLNSINKYYRDGIKQEIDKLAFNDAVNDVINNNRADYESWLRDLFDGVIVKQGIRNQKDTFTPSGNRRSWDSLHDEYNLMNIVKAMKSEPDVGIGFGGFNIFGSVNREFESVDDIHSEESRLQLDDQEKYDKIKDEISKDLYDIARHLIPSPGYDAYSIVSDIAEAAAKRKTRNGIKNFLSEWYEVSESDMDDIMDIIERAKSLPTGYFEAKPQRAVGFDEIANVIVPDMETELISKLEEKNIPYTTYKAGDKEARKKALNSLPDVRFSKKVDSEGKELTEAQDNFFKDSKAVDKKGNLLVLYHGSQSADRFNTFDMNIRGIVNGRAFGDGFYFTPYRDVADFWGEKNLYKVYLNLTNPYYANKSSRVPKDVKKLITDRYTESLSSKRDVNRAYRTEVKNAYDALEVLWRYGKINDLKTLGYDGVIFDDKDVPKYSVQYVAFNPEQIKETTNLNPTQEAKDIRYSISVGEDRIHTYKGIEIIQNPSNKEYQQMRADIIKERPWMDGPDTILLRHTYDEEGNEYYWDAYAGMHFEIEPVIAEHWKTRVNQQWEWWKDDDKDFWANRSFSRYSKDVFGESSPYSETLQQTEYVSQVLSTLNNQLKGTSVSVKYIEDTVKYILDKYKSNVSEEDLTHQLMVFIAYMTTEDRVDYKQMMNYLMNIGDDIIRASELKDPESERVYGELKKELSSHKINLTEVERKELIAKFGGSWNAVFGKLNQVGIKLDSKTGQRMDAGIYEDIANKFREIAGVYLDESKTPVDQIATIIDAMDALSPTAYEWDGATDMDKALDVATTIIDRYYSMATSIKEANIVKGTEKGAAAVERAKKTEIKKLRAKQAEWKEKLNADFAALVEDKKKMVAEQQEFYRKQAEAEKKFRGEKRKFNQKMNMSEKELQRTAKVMAKMEYQGLKDTEAKRKNKDNIVRTCMRLINWMNKPTEAKHVPTFLKPALSDMIKSIDFMPASMRKGEDGTISAQKWQTSMRKLQQVLASMNAQSMDSMDDSDKYNLALVLDAEDIVVKMEELLNKYNGTADISKMSKEDLKTLSDIMTNISTGISKMNENFMNRRFKHVSDAAVASMDEMDSLKPISDDMNVAKSKAADLLNLDMLDPYSFFHELGDAAKSIMQEFYDGEKIGVEIIREAEGFFDNLVTSLNITQKDLRAWENDRKEYHYDGGTITLTPAEIMSLYCSYNREMLDQKERPFEATHHIMSGGIKGHERKVGVGPKATIVNRNPKVLHLTEGEILELINTLTTEQIAYADQVVEYMSTTLAAHGNETSNKISGFSKFLGSKYFPLKTDSNTIRTNESNSETSLAGLMSLIHQSFTKSQLDKADNALVLMNFFDVVTEHVTGMSNYCAYAMPLSDALRWYNFSETERNNTDVEDVYWRQTRTVKESMEKVKGKGAKNYFENFLRDVNLDPANKGGSKFVANAARVLTGLGRAKAIALNISVWVQQPTAIVRASDVIEGKYLRQGIMQMMKNPIKSVKYAQATNYLCYWKSKGFSDYRVSMGMKEIITGYNTKLQEAQEIAGKPAGIADDITWAAMYFAAENKIKDTTDLDTNSQEYRTAVDELFSEIINQTQVIDSTLRTTQTMRSKNDFEYLANAFKKEPQKSYNMLHRAAFNVKQSDTPEAKNAADKEFRKTLSVFMLTSLVNGMVVAAVQAWRDDDDENYLLKWLKKLTPYGAYESIKTAIEDGKLTDKEIEPLLRGIWGGMGTAADNADILSAIPLVAEFDSFLKGYSPSTLNYTSILTEANKTINSVFSATSTPYNALYSLSALTDYITGLGVSNAMRDIRGIWNQTTRVTGLPRIEKSTKAEADAKKNKNMDALVDAINNATNTTDKASAKADIYAAVDAIYQYKYDTYINDKENPKTPEEAEKSAKTQSKSSITSQFKPEYKQLVADKKYTEATTLEKNLIYAYGRLGYKVSHDDFTDWLKE